MQPSGTITFSGFRQPALSGISSLTSVRNVHLLGRRAREVDLGGA
jgi:hypothetical protein